MMHVWRPEGGRLVRLDEGVPLSAALWIDLDCPTPEQAAAVAALGVAVPTLAEMEEIELSARLYREGGASYMTVTLPGASLTKDAVIGPVTFIVTAERLVTVRHHAPRPFETYPERAHRTGSGCETPDRLFLGLIEEIVGRQADILEQCGRALDAATAQVYADGGAARAETLQAQLREIGLQSEQIGRVRLALLTLERAIGFFGQSLVDRPKDPGQRGTLKGLIRDIRALEVHADFLSSRVTMAAEATLGMINISQAQTIKIVSVVAVVFLPPTVIASAYGMNFEVMPELGWDYGYPMALALMLASAVGTYLFFKWKQWL